MGSLPTQTSPSLRSLIKWNMAASTAVIALSHALPILIEWLVSISDRDHEEPHPSPSVLTPWLDRTQVVFAVFAPALCVGSFLGGSISRLYRIDVANVRRKNTAEELHPDLWPQYLVESEEGPRESEDVDGEANPGRAVRILSPPGLLASRDALRQLLYPPWYSGAAYLCLVLMLSFGMPTLVSLSPLLVRLKVRTNGCPVSLLMVLLTIYSTGEY